MVDEPDPPRSTGPFGAELPPVPEGVEPAPEPVPLNSTGPFGAELLLPLVDEPDPDPVPQKSTGPFGAELPVPNAEPGVELPPPRTIPEEEEVPGSSTAVVDPNPLKESVPSPANIARDSSDSKAVRVDGCVFLRRADRMASPPR